MKRFAPEIEAAIDRHARANGMDPATLRAFVAIESGGNPNLVNRYGYSGLLQLQPREMGGAGSVLDPEANLAVGARKLKGEADAFAAKYGRQPTAADLYLIHQQGAGGAAAHMANPDAPAWTNMAGTGEGRQKGEGWAKRAIWGNVPDDVKAQYGSVENMTSRQFMDLWANKVARFGGQAQPPAPMGPPAAAAPQPPDGMDARTYNTAEPPNLTAQRPSPAPASMSNAVAERQPAPSGGVLEGIFGGDPLRGAQNAVAGLFGLPQPAAAQPSEAHAARPQQDDLQRMMAQLAGDDQEAKREQERRQADEFSQIAPMGVPQARRVDLKSIISNARQPIRLDITRA